MNKRIKELINQATTSSFNEDGAGFHRFDKEKFAELIIRECTSLFDGSKEIKTVGFLSHEQVVSQIKEHFGINETAEKKPARDMMRGLWKV